VRKGVGILLWLAGHIISFLTLSAAFVYVIGAVFWMHAPVPDLLQATAMMALMPLGLAWLCWRGGKHLKEKTPAVRLSPKTRCLLAVIGIAVVVSSAAIIRRGLSEYECRLDRSRNTAAHEAEERRNGFERVCEGDLARFEISFSSIATATQKLAFSPVDLTHTPFASIQSLGGKTELVGDIPSRLYRGFRTPDGHRLTLFEHDMSADGSSTWRDPKDAPERINNLPARLVVLEDSSGTAVSLLSWVEGRRAYQLWSDANVVREPLRGQLFALAASLPHSVPACPNELPPKQVSLGADGRPVDEKKPEVLTQAHIEAMVNTSKRPCK
jgi:hypothetical protein